MRKSFVSVTKPMLAGVVKERAKMDAIAEVRNCEYHGATSFSLFAF